MPPRLLARRSGLGPGVAGAFAAQEPVSSDRATGGTVVRAGMMMAASAQRYIVLDIRSSGYRCPVGLVPDHHAASSIPRPRPASLSAPRELPGEDVAQLVRYS